MDFPVVGPAGPTWTLERKQLAEWQALYPNLDVEAEMRKALAWVQVNHRKTARGMPRFLVSWLNRATDRRQSDRRQEPRETPERRAYDLWKTHGCQHTPKCGNFSTCQVVSQRRQAS